MDRFLGDKMNDSVNNSITDFELQVRNIVGSLRIEGLALDHTAQQCLAAMQTQSMSVEQAIEHFKRSIRATAHEVQR